MNKKSKRLFASVALGFSVLILTSCTKSFCSVQDQAEQMANYEKNNLEKVNKKAEESGLLLPQPIFIDFIDKKVENYISLEECPKDSYGQPLKSFAKFAGYNSGKAKLWYNFDIWCDEARETIGIENVPSKTYLDYYKRAMKTGVAGSVACLTPEDGKFGLAGNEIYVEGKSWGEAFSDYGPVEGLLVYPIGCMLHYFTKAFGTGGGGQVAAIILVTVIIRLLVLLITFPSTLSQSKMGALQPEINALQQKYPNSQTVQSDKQRLAQETMALYKEHKIHPFLQVLFMFVQLPVFICVWSALQGSAILTQGTVFGLELTTVTYSAILSGTSQTPFAIVLFVMMAIAQIISTLLPQWFQSWKAKEFTVKTTVVQPNQQQNTMKMMSYVMMVFILIMGITLPAAMAIYWFIGAIISIIQNLAIEAFQSHTRHKKNKNGKSSSSWNRNKKDKKKDRFSIRKG